MLIDRFLRHRRGVRLEDDERSMLEAALGDIQTLGARNTLVRAGTPLTRSTLLLEGFVSRFIEDRNGLRQLVAIHVPGDFIDLHAFPLRALDHDIATLTAVKIANIPHSKLGDTLAARPSIAPKLWYATLIDAAIHRAWLFRLGRLDAIGRVAHFLCETNLRLVAAGLSDGRSFKLGIIQSDLAEICGLTNVHINRVMRILREEKFCVFRSSRVEILDLDRLGERGQFDPDYLYLDDNLLPQAGAAS